MWRYRYITTSEKKLNRGLWAILVISLVYSVFQHVILADVHEVVPHGAQLGDLLYDLAIAYVGAFAFYLLVVRVPQLRDRENVYQYVEMLLWQLIEHSRGLIIELDRMSRVTDRREQTPEERAIAMGEQSASLMHVTDLCSRIGPEQDIGIVESMTNQRSVTPVERLRTYMASRRQPMRDLQTFAPYLASDAVALVAVMDLSPIERILETFTETTRSDLSALAAPIHSYLTAAWRLNQYRREIFGNRTIGEMAADLEVAWEQSSAATRSRG